MMLDAVLSYIDGQNAQAIERLSQLLSIPSVSTQPEHAADVAKAAQWVANQLKDVGLKANVKQTKGHPVVLAHSLPGDLPPDAPRVLFYGHYDVQPPEPLEKWTSPPFSPTLTHEALVARGASDDKGPVVAFIEALRAWKHVTGSLPVHVTVLIEGEEEMGSPSLREFLVEHRDALEADFILISDTGMWDRNTIAITYGLRGLAYYEVSLQGPSHDLHSGVYGGSIANPANELTRVLGKLIDDNGHISIPGFYDDVIYVTAQEKKRWAILPFDEADYFKSINTTAWGEKNYSTIERRWARPSCDICGLTSGYQGPGAKTVLPSTASAKVSFRLAPNQNHKRIGELLEQWLHSHDVHGCQWTITDLHGAEPVITPTDSPWVRAATYAASRITGRPTVLMREGATIPVVATFKEILGLDAVMVGFGLPDDRIHSPNEKWDLKCYEMARKTHASILGQIAKEV